MVDPELVAIGAEASARLTDLGVMPEPGGEGEEPQPDAGAQAREWSICRGELEGDRGPVARAEQIEAKAPEVARVRAAVAVGCDPRELGSSSPRGGCRAGRGARCLRSPLPPRSWRGPWDGRA